VRRLRFRVLNDHPHDQVWVLAPRRSGEIVSAVTEVAKLIDKAFDRFPEWLAPW
jgi:hypothetical protein